MGIGQLGIPLYLASLPDGMTFTINEVTQNVPTNFWASTDRIGELPRTIKASDVATACKSDPRGTYIGGFELRTGGFGLSSGQGGSFLVKFTISGRPSAYPDVAPQDMQGALSIGTSKWGTFSRPDKIVFQWQIAGTSSTFTADVPMLTSPDNSLINIGYAPDKSNYVITISSQQSTIIKILQGMIGGIFAGHAAIWSYGAGLAAATVGTATAVGTAAYAAVAWAAHKTDGI
ncbi:hypothetical protein BGX34_006337 [Mortierella sp. NVP85]|nr:hypothetical protein BGX34_006337 [Mortierella sp. NVP85]